MSWKTKVPSRLTPVRTVISVAVRRTAWKRLLEGQDEAARPAGFERHESDEGLVFGVLLSAERATGVRSVDAHLGQRQAHDLGHHALQPVRMLDRGPDGQTVAVRRGDEGMRLDGEMGDHREVVGVLDD